MKVNIFGTNLKKPMTMTPRTKARSLPPLDTGIFSPNPTWGRFFNTLWTGDADLRLCITTVEDG